LKKGGRGMKIDNLNLNLKATVNTDELDETLQKMNRLKGLLEEVNILIGSIKDVDLEIKVGSEL
jgi:hypothetical protein